MCESAHILNTPAKRFANVLEHLGVIARMHRSNADCAKTDEEKHQAEYLHLEYVDAISVLTDLSAATAQPGNARPAVPASPPKAPTTPL